MEQDVDVRDVIEDGDLTIVYAEPDQFAHVQDALRQTGVEEFKVAEFEMLPKLILNYQRMTKQHLRN